MRVVMCQPAINRFKWELEVSINNLMEHGYNDIMLLFTQDDLSVVEYFINEYPTIDVHAYSDRRKDKFYHPGVKPYLWMKHLEAHPEDEIGEYMYIDSDVIFRERLDHAKLNPTSKLWYCSDCTNYLGYDYIMSRTNSYSLIKEMASIVGVSVDSIKELGQNAGGAQWIIKDPTFAYWEKVYKNSSELYMCMQRSNSNIQIWTAEMWSQLWNMIYFGIKPRTDSELEFSWSTDPIDCWYQTKIYHNAGVTSDRTDLFFKGQYVNRTPFDEDLSFVNDKMCSIKYVEAIKGVKMKSNG